MVAIKSIKRLRDCGFFCIPITSKKKPIPKYWTVAKPDVAERWRFCCYNVAVRTGDTFFVLDLDMLKEGEDLICGRTYFEELLKLNNIDDVNTVCARSGGGGLHYYFNLPSKTNVLYSTLTKTATNIIQKDGVGIKWDIRGIGGCIISPPSMNASGGKYKWIRSPWEYKILDIPDFLLLAIIEGKKKPETKKKKINIKQEEDITVTTEKYVTYSPTTMSEIEALLTCLKANRCRDYSDWRNVGMILHYEGVDFTIWDKWSQGCKEKYNAESVKNAWQGTVDANGDVITPGFNRGVEEPLTIKSLKWYAKEDNPELFNIIQEEYKSIKFKQREEIKLPANEIVFEDNREISSYLVRLTRCWILCIKSNAMTFKTQGLPEVIEQYKSVVIISFRISLEREYHQSDKFKKFNFTLYSESKSHVLNDDKLIVQVDSLFRVGRTYEVVILDEIEYIKGHIFDFIKSKREIYNRLVELISHSVKTIVCDALLKQSTVDWLRRLFQGKEPLGDNLPSNYVNVLTVVNIYQSFKGKTVDIVKGDSLHYIKYVISCVTKEEKVYCPINSKRVAKDLYYMLVGLGIINVLIIYKDTILSYKDGFETRLDSIETERWIDYDALIITPTIVAGISFNEKHYDRRVGYFTNYSCDADSGFQMTLRVRNTTLDKDVIWCSTHKFSESGFPVTTDGVDRLVATQRRMREQHSIDYSNITKKIEMSEYYLLYRDYLCSTNMAKLSPEETFAEICKLHGIAPTIRDQSEVIEIPKEVLTKTKIDIKEKRKEERQREADDIFNARDITDKTKKEIEVLKEKTSSDTLALRRCRIREVYGIHDLTREKIVDLGFNREMERYRYVPIYGNSLLDIITIIDHTIEDKIYHDAYNINVTDNERLGFRLIIQSLVTLGFNNIGDRMEHNDEYNERLYNHYNTNVVKNNYKLCFPDHQPNLKHDEQLYRRINVYLTARLTSIGLMLVRTADKHREGKKFMVDKVYKTLELHDKKLYDKHGIFYPKNTPSN